MSARNGQRARFHLNRKRRIVQRQRVHALMIEILKKKADDTQAASNNMRSEGGPAVTK